MAFSEFTSSRGQIYISSQLESYTLSTMMKFEAQKSPENEYIIITDHIEYNKDIK